MTDTKFLKQVQQSGWQIDQVSEDACTVKCPTSGCSFRAKLKQGGFIPNREVPRFTLDIPITDFDKARRALKDRREALALVIRDVEDIAGIATDHLAKFERENWYEGTRRMPNAQTFIEWAQALGYEMVLRPTELTPYALSVIAQTRNKSRTRKSRNATRNKKANNT